MTTLYPPYIEGKLPAQYGDTLRIPFSFNKAGGFIGTSQGEIVLKLRTVTTDKNPLVTEAADAEVLIDESPTDGVAHFQLQSECLLPGQFYKAQIQLTQTEGRIEHTSPWSTVGVFKYIEVAENAIQIQDLVAGSHNSTKPTYKGVYTISPSDPFEKVVEYRFDVFSNGRLIETTDWQMHSAATDADNESYDLFTPASDLEDGAIYLLQYSIRTANNYVVSSSAYPIQSQNQFPLEELPVDVTAVNNYDNGSIDIVITAEENANDTLCGEYVFYRKEKNATRGWEQITEVIIDKQLQSKEEIFRFSDCNVEQGVTYQYAIAQVDKTPGVELTTDKQIFAADGVTADFEDMFLWDADMRLRLRFNPKVTSLKQTTLEQKMDTLGGRYPVFFRNGRVSYKEFPISALITMHMEDDLADETVRGATPNNEDEEFTPTGFLTNPGSQNLYSEREYKLKVLEWLNNGKPKVFSSPAEGKYLVRLMGVSLSPMDQLGRMLHTFSATAYEVGTSDYSSLIEQGMISNTHIEKIDNLKVASKTLVPGESFSAADIIQATIRDTAPGTIVRLTYKNTSQPIDITIGSTQYYNIFIEKSNPLVEIEVLEQRDNGVYVPWYVDMTNRNITIDYSYYKLQRYPIYDDGKVVNSVSYTEKVERYLDAGTYSFDNIIYLRLMKKFEEDIADADKNADDLYLYKLNGSNETLDLTTVGTVTYDVRNCIQSVTFGPGIYMDIVYIERTVVYKEEEV